MEPKKSKIASIITYIKEARKDPKKKMVLFFAFYFVFFLIIIIMVRLNGNNTSIQKENLIGSKYSLDQLKKGNYHYVYDLKIGTEGKVIDGERNGNIESFEVKENGKVTSFYQNSKECLKKENGTWVKTENPNKYSYITDIDNLEKILAKATYISKTEYKNNELDLNYEISTTTLTELLDGKKIDIDDETNKIVIRTDINKEAYAFTIDLEPYFTYINNKDTEAKFKLTYNNFGNVEEIINPKK